MISINSTQVVGLEQQGSDVQWAICSIECDTSSELPTYDQFKQTHNILLYQKSFAHVIDKNEIYEMNGQGSWIRQKSNSNIMLDAENVIYDNTNSGLSAENVQDAIDEIKSNDDMQDEALVEVENKGAKNLFKITAVSEVKQGVRFTVNTDGTVTVTRESAGTSNAFLTLGLFTGDAGVTYTLSGCPATGSDSTYYMYIGSTFRDYGSGVSREGGTERGIVIYVDKNYSPDNLVFKPMLCTKAEWDISQAYVPYGKTNAELTSDISALSAENTRQETEIGIVANAGAKNNFNIASPNAIDYKTTHNISDDSVTITGSAGFSRYVVPVSLKAGSYIFTANVNSISTSGRVRFNTASDGTGTNVTSQIDFSQAGSISREFTIAQDTAFFVMIYSSTSSTDTASTLVISQCMIRPASITDSTYVPYSPSNRELYEDKATVDDIFGVKKSLTAGTDLNDITTPGKYVCGGATVAVQLLHCPTTTNGFIMLVDYVADVSRIIQRIYSYNTTSGAFEVFYRSYISTGWTDWQRGLTDATLDEIPTANSTNAVMSGGVQAPLAEVIDSGAKNLLQFTSASTGDRNGITYDIQDGTVTISGTPTDSSVNSFVILKLGNTSIDAAPYCDGNHVLSGCPDGGSDTNFRFYAVSGTQYVKSDYGNGVLLDTTGITNIYVVIAVYPAYYPTLAQTPLVFRPMICTKAEWDVSQKFVPYAPTNRELYEMILAIQSQLGMRSVQSISRSLDSTYDLLDTIQEEPDESEER